MKLSRRKLLVASAGVATLIIPGCKTDEPTTPTGNLMPPQPQDPPPPGNLMPPQPPPPPPPGNLMPPPPPPTPPTR